MRYVILLVAAVIGFVMAGTMLKDFQGLVTFDINGVGYTVSTTYFLIVLLAAIILLIVAFKLIWTLIRLPKNIKRLGKNRQQNKANSLLQKGMLAMGKGQWRKAEKILVKGAKLSSNLNMDTSLFLSTAATAAQNQGEDARRDEYLLQARQLKVEGSDVFASTIAEARLFLDNDEPEKALASLDFHKEKRFVSPEMLNLETDAHIKMSNYDKAWELLPYLKKQTANKKSFFTKQTAVAKKIFESNKYDANMVNKAWKSLSKEDKTDDETLLSYVSSLLYLDKFDMAEKVLSSAIKKDYSDYLINAYTQLDGGSSTAKLAKIEKWLKFCPDSAYLNYGAAKFALQSEQLDKARDFAEKSIKEQPMPESFAILGEIYEKQEEPEKALAAYKHSVGLTYHKEEPVLGELLLANDNDDTPKLTEQT